MKHAKRFKKQRKMNIVSLLSHLKRGGKKTGLSAVALLIICVMVFSILPTIQIFSADEADEASLSQTKYSDINDFQNARIAEIQKEIFIPAEADAALAEKRWNDGFGKPYARDGAKYNDGNDIEGNMVNWDVRAGNKFFNWTKNVAAKDDVWDGINNLSVDDCTKLFDVESVDDFPTRVYKYNPTTDVTDDGIMTKSSETKDFTYIVMNVENANQFRWAMMYTKEWAKQGENVLINITKDLDLGGQNKTNWESVNIMGGSNINTVYIEGNGHTLYNFRTSQNGLFDTCLTNLIVKNFGIKTSMITTGASKGENTAFIYGTSYGGAQNRFCKYLYNVHVSDSYVQNYTSNYVAPLVGRTNSHYGMFIKNCSTSNNIVIGQKHISGFVSYTQGMYDTNKAPRYDVEFPSSPEEIIFDDYPRQHDFYYPAMFENCYSIDTELFSLSNDSGAFISCGGMLVVRNCFTNNNIYADSNTGGFFGRDICVPAFRDDAGELRISNYFENCYSSGLVEGRNSLGGFIGYVETLRHMETSYVIGPNTVEEGFDYDHSKENHAYDSIVNLVRQTGSNVFKNCYSSAAVGMDYAGRFCGGFTGLDDNYAVNVTLNIDGETVNFNGSAYINCYAVGEVGNILTVSSTDNAINNNYEARFLANDKTGEGKDNKNGDTVTILEYYPTGGFIGALCPDRWWVATAAEYKDKKYNQFTPDQTFETALKAAIDADEECRDTSTVDQYRAYNKVFGYFKNCFYDMQTTGMREMAIGMQGGDYTPAETDSNYNVYEGDYYKVDFKFKTCNGTPTEPFSLPGVTGVYTVASEVKDFDGLTSFPNGPQKHAMDTKGEASDVWNYLEGYYPQLDVFMTTDIAVSQTDADTLEGVTVETLKKSPFYIPISDVEVGEDDVVSGTVSQIVDGHDSLSEVLTAFRYSQASTAAVMLNHWDSRMNIANGMLSTDADWVAVPENEMTDPEEGDKYDGEYYYLEYKDVPAGAYQFKIQAGETSTINYGKNRFKGENCDLVLTADSNVTIKFKYIPNDDGTITDFSNYYILADILSDKDGDGTKESLEENRWLGGKEIGADEEIVVVGEMPGVNWDVNDTTYKMTRNKTDTDLYEITVPFEAKKDEDGNKLPTSFNFKIVKNHAWATSFGYNGVQDGGNMSFTINDDCNVKFIFNNKTHFTTVKCDDKLPEGEEGHVTNTYTTEAVKFDFEGISVIGQRKLTGHDWLEAGSSETAIASAEDGRMTETEENSGIYTKTYENIPMGDKYAYKVIEDAVDEGENSFFYIDYYVDESITTCTVTITYDKNEDECWASAIVNGTEYVQNGLGAAGSNSGFSSCSVLGDIGLTGYHWAGQRSDFNSEEEYEQYKATAIQAGMMTRNNNLWTVTFNNVEVGTYGFKVALDGDLDYSYGKPDTNENYSIELTKQTNVTITFNSATRRISVTTSPDESALKTTTYVVTGTENLTGYIWDKKNGIMSYDVNKSLYYYNFTWARFPDTEEKSDYLDNGGKLTDPRPIKANGTNYALKVIPQDVDQGSNKSFSLGVDLTTDQTSGYLEYYYLQVTYDAVKDKTELCAYEDMEMTIPADPDPINNDINVLFYSVLGDKGLTGYNWLGLQDNGYPGEKWVQEAASKAGMMTEELLDPNDEENNPNGYTKRFYKSYSDKNEEFNPVQLTDDVTTYSFKVAANGNWDSGIDYGDGKGNDYIIRILKGDNFKGDTCNLTIYFYPEEEDLTEKIKVELDGDYGEDLRLVTELRYDSFKWFVVGDYQLTSGTAFIAPVTVYDTVRDITRYIEFTTGAETVQRGISWQIDTESNTLYDYIPTLGGENGFKLKYDVDKQGEVTGTFKDSIIDFSYEIREDVDFTSPLKCDDNYTYYLCDDFMPGKQFLTVSAVGYGYSETYNQWQEDLIKLNQYLSDLAAFDELAEMYYIRCGITVEKDEEESDEDRQQRLRNKLLEHLKLLSDKQLKDHIEELGDITPYMSVVSEKKPQVNDTPDISDQSIIGTRRVRLIPQGYLEAGWDAEISVIKDRGTTGASNNKVKYLNTNEGTTNNTFVDSNGKSIEDRGYNYYNYAFTSAYAMTDKIGLGIYDNYQNQIKANPENDDAHGLVYYDYNLRRQEDAIVDAEGKNIRKAGTYFAMTSTYVETEEYKDNITAEGALPINNLSAGYLSKQALIGDSYDYNSYKYLDSNNPNFDSTAKLEDKKYGQTIIKVMKVNDDGSKETLYFDSSKDDSYTERQLYDKWSAKSIFEPSDEGNYEVHFYWLMSDGRYFEDYKKVIITSIMPGISKTVDKVYDDEGNDNTLKYTVQYSNVNSNHPVTFALLDILPFDNDAGIIYNKDLAISNEEKGENKHDFDQTHITKTEVGRDVSFTLKSISTTQSGDAKIKGVYYTTDPNVRNYLYKDPDNPEKIVKWEDYNIEYDPNADDADEIADEIGEHLDEEAAKWLGLKPVIVGDDDPFGGKIPFYGATKTDTSVPDYKYTTGKDKYGIEWTLIERTGDFENETIGDYVLPDEDGIEGVTAVVVTGVQLAVQKNVGLVMDVEYDGKANDYLVNNAFYHALLEEDGDSVGGAQDMASYSNNVMTTIVSRDFSGNVWLDIDNDGIWDEDEAPIEGVKVTLYKQDEDSEKFVETGKTTKTDENGYYVFDKLLGGTYRAVFSAPEGNMVTIREDKVDSSLEYRTIDFDKLMLSQHLSEYQVNETNAPYGSRNIADLYEVDYGRDTKDDASKVSLTSSKTELSSKAKAVDLDDENVVYVKNNGGWDEIYCYMWGSSGNNGEWPGEKMTYIGNNTWRYTVLSDAYTQVIFNNNNGTQTYDLTYSGTNYIYDNIYNKSIIKDASDAPKGWSEYEPPVIYVKNEAGWESISCYMWGDNGDNGKWPGGDMEYVGNDIWKYTVPSDKEYKKIIFFGGDDDHRIDNLDYEPNRIYNNSTGEISGLPVIYFQNDAGWDEVYCYMWGDGENAAWSGVKMTELGNGIWYYYVPVGKNFTNVIFNDGTNDDSRKTKDLNYIGPDRIYSYSTGKWSQYPPDDTYTPQPDYPDYNSYYLDVRLLDTRTIYGRISLNSIYNAYWRGGNDYYYQKRYQSAALAERNSLKLQKIAEVSGGDPTPLKGAVFRIEYLVTSDDGGEQWKRLTYEYGVAVFVDSNEEGVGEYITGEDGILEFKNLPDGKYRVTEIKTAEGNNKLASSVEIELPYEAVNTSEDFFIQTANDESAYKTRDGKYRDVTMRITNTLHLNDLLPLTGLNDLRLWLILLGILLILAGTSSYFYIAKKKKQKSPVTAQK